MFIGINMQFSWIVLLTNQTAYTHQFVVYLISLGIRLPVQQLSTMC